MPPQFQNTPQRQQGLSFPPPQPQRPQGLPLGGRGAGQAQGMAKPHPAAVNLVKHALLDLGGGNAGSSQAPRPNGGGMPGVGQSPLGLRDMLGINDQHRVALLQHAIALGSDPIHGPAAQRVMAQHIFRHNLPRSRDLLAQALQNHVQAYQQQAQPQQVPQAPQPQMQMPPPPPQGM